MVAYHCGNWTKVNWPADAGISIYGLSALLRAAGRKAVAPHPSLQWRIVAGGRGCL